ncbi:MAG TPA: hypothetical protein VLW44_05185 [Streptosporangiaceae bacterium]|nr:hypothetical protein [Streptosporangiaceae bacterium]
MSPPVQLLVAIALPIGAVYSLIGGGRLARWVFDSWLPERRSRGATPEPVQRLGANLVRLRSQLEAMETRTDLPAKNLRLRALRAAYVDALNDACQRLDVDPPASAARARPGDVRQAEIYRVEAALRERGLDVREKAGR